MSDVDFSTALALLVRDAVREEVATLKQPQAEKKDTKATLRGIRALAVYLGVSTATAQRLKNEGKVPFSQVGKRVFFVPCEVDNAIKVNTNEL